MLYIYSQGSEGVTLEELAKMVSEWVLDVPAYSDPIKHQLLEVKVGVLRPSIIFSKD